MRAAASGPSGDGPISLWSDDMYTRVARMARAYPKSWFLDRDDLQQEACLALRRWEAKTGQASMPPRLFTHVAKIAMHKHYRSFRGMGLRTASDNLAGDHEPASAPADDDADARMDVADAVGRLTDESRWIVQARYFEGASYGDVAARLGRHPNRGMAMAMVAYGGLRGRLRAGYGPEVARIRERKPRKDPKQRLGRGVDWSKWGPIPGQRDDD